MIVTLITLLIVALVLFLIWYLVGLFIKDARIMNIIGIILGLILLLYAMQSLGIFGGHLVR